MKSNQSSKNNKGKWKRFLLENIYHMTIILQIKKPYQHWHGFFIGVTRRYSPEIILGGCPQINDQGRYRYKTPLKII